MAIKTHFIDTVTDILVKRHLIPGRDKQSLKKSFQESEMDEYDDFLLESGMVQESDLLEVLSEYFTVPSFDVNGYFFERKILTKFPKDFLLRHAIIPAMYDGDMLLVVAADPNQVGLESAIRNYVTNDILFNIGIRRDICDMVKEFYDPSLTEVVSDQDLRKEREEEREERDIEDYEK